MKPSDNDIIKAAGGGLSTQRIEALRELFSASDSSTDDSYYVIYFENVDAMGPEFYTDEKIAFERFEQVCLTWTAHLFERIAQG